MNFTVESKTYTKSPAELATQLNAQKPIEAPVAASARRRWLKARPMLLLGTASKDSSVVTRDALVLRLSYLADDITTPEGLAKKLATFAPEHLLLIDADSGLDGRLHAHLVIPLTSPLKVSLGDDELYIAAQQIWLAQLRSRKVLTQVPRLRKDEWDQHMVWPTPTQAAKPVAFYHDGPVTDTDTLRSSAQAMLAEHAQPDGRVKGSKAAMQYVRTHEPLEIMHDFADLQGEWLSSPTNRKACLLHLRTAENAGELDAAGVADCIGVLAGDDSDLAADLQTAYADVRQPAHQTTGLEFFVQEKMFGNDDNWLSFTPSGKPVVDVDHGYPDVFVKKHHVLYTPDAPGGVAFFYGGHWRFGAEAQKWIEFTIVNELRHAGAFHLTTLRECLKSVQNEATVKDADATPFSSAPKNLIEFQNVTYDIMHDKFIPNSASNMQLKYVPFVMKTHDFKTPTLTLAWLGELVGHDKKALRTLVRFIGYSFLSTSPHEVMLYLLGNGGNGKSFLLRYIRSFFGTKQSSLSWHSLTTTSDRFSMAQLAGAFINVTGDIETVKTDAAQKLKPITGSDAVTVEKKGVDPFSIDITAKLYFAANRLPSMNDFTGGFYRRPRVIKMPLKLESSVPAEKAKARAFKLKYTPEALAKEASDFAHYAIREYAKADHPGASTEDVFPESPTMVEAKSRWIKTSDSVGNFIDKYLTYSPAIATEKDGDVVKEMYKTYQYVANEAGNQPVARSRFVDRILDIFDGTAKIRAKRRGIQATRLQGVVFNIDGLDIIEHDMGWANNTWVQHTYYFTEWRAQDENPKPLL